MTISRLLARSAVLAPALAAALLGGCAGAPPSARSAPAPADAPPPVRRELRGVWVASVAGGMLLRRVTGEGTAVSFVVVATVVLGAALLGWRAVAGRRWTREPA